MAMEPAWTQFESTYKSKVNLIMINVDEDKTAEFKKYMKIRGKDQMIPATYWVDAQGKVLQSKVGGMSATQLGAETDSAAKRAR
ncbi:MAG: hypothetical protein U0931_16285 [Vulcanimicrobiota bacterium]